MIGRITGVVLTLTVVTGVVGCADGSGEVRSEGSSSESSGDERLASGPFRLIDQEDVYLNGVENEGRPPISFFLVGSDPSDATASEGDLVAAYAEAMRRDGWQLDPYSTDEDWWVFYGGKGSESLRVGPASRFVALATADEGYSRSKFRRVVSEFDGPLVVVSIDPHD